MKKQEQECYNTLHSVEQVRKDFPWWKRFLLWLGMPFSVGFFLLPGSHEEIEYWIFRCWYCGEYSIDCRDETNKRRHCQIQTCQEPY